MKLTQDAIKKKVAEYAADRIQDGMLVGIGTGSTVRYFIDRLLKRCQEGLKISAIATSNRSHALIAQGKIPLLDPGQLTQLDVTVDGADEIDLENRMVKGGGGALLREKILASSSKKMVVIVDETKAVDLLGKFGVAIEIIPFCYLSTLAKMRKLGFDGKMRYLADGQNHYVTDNGNLIFDLHTPQTFPHPEISHEILSAIPGVVETGFFYHLPVEVLIGYEDGRIVNR